MTESFDTSLRERANDALLGRRTLTLKGIPDPVEEASIAWN